MSQQSALPSDFQLGHYKIEKYLHRGAFGITYLAIDQQTKQHVVIKENLPECIYSRKEGEEKVKPHADLPETGKMSIAWAEENFQNEGKLLSKFKHPNLVRWLDAFYSPRTNSHFYVMSYLSGGTLADYFKSSGQLSKDEVLCIAKCVLSALDYLHREHQTLHRDLKPANILLSREGVPTLIDFGTARPASKDDMTQLCTPDYAACEQLFSDPNEPELQLGAWTDIYSLGAILYLGITKSLPLSSRTRKISSKDKYEPLAKNPQYVSTYGRILLASIDKALALKASHRFLTARDWLNKLQSDSDFASSPDILYKASPDGLTVITRPIYQSTLDNDNGELLSKPFQSHTKRNIIIVCLACLACLIVLTVGYFGFFHDDAHQTTQPSSQQEKESQNHLNTFNKRDDKRAEKTVSEPAPVAPTQPKQPKQPEHPEQLTSNKEELPKQQSQHAISFAPKVLTTPGAKLYDSAQIENASASTMPTYTVLYKIKEMNDLIEVGHAPDRTAGYIKKDACVSWDNNIVVRFTHPSELRRNRALFFKSKQAAEQFAALDERTQSKLQQAAEAGKASAESGIVAIEPKSWVNKGNFYLLPLTGFSADTDGSLSLYEFGQSEESALVEIQAVTETLTPKHSPAPSMAKPRVDIVFVMDLSSSMRPYVHDLREGIEKIANSVGSQLKDQVRFGLWGYQDWCYYSNGRVNEDLCDFVTWNYTPKLLTVNDFIKTLREDVKPTTKNSADYAEDMITGVHDAIYRTNWRNPTNDEEEGEVIRFVILIGDAAGREVGETENDRLYQDKSKATGNLVRSNIAELVSGMNASDKHIYLQSFFIRTPKPSYDRITKSMWEDYLSRGEEQFRQLSRRNGVSSCIVIEQTVKGQNLTSDFTNKANGFIETLISQIIESSAGAPSEEQLAASSDDSGDEAEKQAHRLFANAYVEWVADQAPEHVDGQMRGWVFDTANDNSTTLERCVLLSEHTLEELTARIDDMIKSFNKSTTTGLINQMKGSSAQNVGGGMAKRDDIAVAVSELREQEVIKLISSLPYKSRIMQFDPLETSEQELITIRNDLISKLQKYKKLNSSRNQKDLWFKMEDGTSIIVMPLSDLP